MYSWLKRLLFLFEPERAHRLTLRLFKLSLMFPGAKYYWRRQTQFDPRLAQTLWGLRFENPVGLAAGFDKNGQSAPLMEHLGFGSIEVGTVTALPQPGNSRPRLFRLRADEALINRMGFNNLGAEAVSQTLRPPKMAVLGINLGKSKVCPLEDAAQDYAASAQKLLSAASYVVINVSSPNTPGLRSLQSVSSLRLIVDSVREVMREQNQFKPLLVKVAPDLADEDLDAIADYVVREGIDGIIATNTTISRDGLSTSTQEIKEIGAGGLSGQPLKGRSVEVLARLWQRTQGQVTLVAGGGIDSADEAWSRICAGASLVQIYSGLIYRGPHLVADINRGLAKHLTAAGFPRLSEAVGSAAVNDGISQ